MAQAAPPAAPTSTTWPRASGCTRCAPAPAACRRPTRSSTRRWPRCRSSGRTATLRTTALATEPLDLDGTLDGNLYLRGGGRPDAVHRRPRGARPGPRRRRPVARHRPRDRRRVRLRPPPRPAADGLPAVDVDVAPLGALMVDRGFEHRRATRPTRRASPRRARPPAARRRRARRTVKGRAGDDARRARWRWPRAARPPSRSLIKAMNVPSDNYIAEMLLKAVGMSDDARGHDRARRGGGRGRGRRGARRRPAHRRRLRPLARPTARRPREVVDAAAGEVRGPGLLRLARRDGRDRDARRTGCASSVARGRCRGKTGTLRDVSRSRGYCETARRRHRGVLDPHEPRQPLRRTARCRTGWSARSRATRRLERPAQAGNPSVTGCSGKESM